jgi:hypothetical protein
MTERFRDRIAGPTIARKEQLDANATEDAKRQALLDKNAQDDAARDAKVRVDFDAQLAANAAADRATAKAFADQVAARLDSAGTPVQLTAASIASQGSQPAFPRVDHTHPIATGAPVRITTGNAADAGQSQNLARADHVHPVSILSGQVDDVVQAQTVSQSYVPLATMAFTLGPGRYRLFADTTLSVSKNGMQALVTLFAGGSQIPSCERGQQFVNANDIRSVVVAKEITLTTSTLVELRWRVGATAGTITSNYRSMSWMRLE